MKIRVLFLINSLNAGGAERQLLELVRNLDKGAFDIHLVAFYDPPDGREGYLWAEAAALSGVSLTSLHKRRGALGNALALPRLLALLVRTDPDIVHGYLEGNLPLLLLGWLLRKRVVWGIRATSSAGSKLDRLARGLLKVMAKASPWVDLIIFNSESGLRSHTAMGMRAPRMEVIPNGFNVEKFCPDPAKGAALRAAWGLPERAPLIGIVGRLDPVKDHSTFLRAAARLAREWPTARFVCVGSGPDDRVHALQAQAQALGLADKVLWPGVCSDMAAVYNALSLLILASTDEGFPNALGEAMACGIPCVTTRVGDAARLVADIGFVVAAGDDAAIARAAGTLLAEGGAARTARAEASRARMCSTYSVDALAGNTGRLLRSLLAESASPVLSQEAGWLAHQAPQGARYLLRFDDLCPTMNWARWDEVEALLVQAGVSPLLSVIPDNRDPQLRLGPPSPVFWDRVRSWQARGWSIGLHGYQHTYVNAEPGLLRLNPHSEFAGLAYPEQLEKLRKGLEVFRREGIHPAAWVAPAHSFDAVTLAALDALGLRTISDGMAFAPYRDSQGLTWIPQQFAKMRPFPWGVWTFCYHLEDLNPAGMARFRRGLDRLGPRMISLQEAQRMASRSRSASDQVVGLLRQTVTQVRRLAE